MNIESRLIVFTQNIKMLSEKNKLSSPVFSLVTLFQYEVGKNNVRTLHYSLVETRGGGVHLLLTSIDGAVWSSTQATTF